MTELESRIIVELSKKVVDNIAKKYEKIRRGVDVIMGGKVIETEAKKMYNEDRNAMIAKVVGVGGTLVCLGLMFAFETDHVITTKALSFVPKPKI